MTPEQIRERLVHVLAKPDGQSINLDAKRRVDVNEPKANAWTLRELLDAACEAVMEGYHL